MDSVKLNLQNNWNTDQSKREGLNDMEDYCCRPNDYQRPDKTRGHFINQYNKYSISGAAKQQQNYLQHSKKPLQPNNINKLISRRENLKT